VALNSASPSLVDHPAGEPLNAAQIRETIEALTDPGTTPEVRRVAQAFKEYVAGNTNQEQLYNALRKVTGELNATDQAQTLSVKRASVEWAQLRYVRPTGAGTTDLRRR
jgi:hypothetical protein